MLYWLFRSGSPLGFVPWLVVMALWWLGGWGLLGAGFEWKAPRERAVAAWGVGLLAYLWGVNVLGRVLPPVWAFALAAVLVALTGMAVERRPWRMARTFAAGVAAGWRLWLVFGVVFLVFLEIEFGILLFDEHKNLSLISTLAAGFIPAINFYDPSAYMPYHYGFQLLGASMVRLGDMFPWVAFDVSKALVWAYALVLLWLVGAMTVRGRVARTFFVAAAVLAGGTRYLLLPPPLLAHLDGVVTLWGATAYFGNTLTEVLAALWQVSGGPPLPWPIAFLSGLRNPMVMGHAGPGTLSIAVLLLLWLLWPKMRSWHGVFVLTVMLSMWALVWETSYGLVMVGTVIMTAWAAWRRRLTAPARWWLGASVASAPVVLLQGGTLTVVAGKVLRALLHVGEAAGAASSSATPAVGMAFGLRWPPAIVSSHLGALSLFSPAAWVVALAEMGVGIVLLPWVLQWFGRRFRADRNAEWLMGAYVAGALFGMILPIFVRYSTDRDITRFTGFGLGLFSLLLALAVADWAEEGRWTLTYTGVGALLLMMVSGVVLGGLQLSAIQRPDFATSISRYDVEVSRQVWDTLPKDALVFDPRVWPAITITGRPTRYGEWLGYPSEAFEALVASPSLQELRLQGYTYVYVPYEWWDTLSPEAQAALQAPCVRLVAESRSGPEADAHFRRLLDIRACIP